MAEEKAQPANLVLHASLAQRFLSLGHWGEGHLAISCSTRTSRSFMSVLAVPLAPIPPLLPRLLALSESQVLLRVPSSKSNCQHSRHTQKCLRPLLQGGKEGNRGGGSPPHLAKHYCCLPRARSRVSCGKDAGLTLSCSAQLMPGSGEQVPCPRGRVLGRAGDTASGWLK